MNSITDVTAGGGIVLQVFRRFNRSLRVSGTVLKPDFFTETSPTRTTPVRNRLSVRVSRFKVKWKLVALRRRRRRRTLLNNT